MKVTGQDPAKTAELTLGKAKGKEGKDARPSPAAGGEARKPAQLPTNASLTTTRVKEAIRNEPDVRAERVAELRERLKSGSYKIDADKLAGKMLDESIRDDLEKP
ncbi:MAG: flagellar biosynthesis anti-sigma factor FlgM [bacterium]